MTVEEKAYNYASKVVKNRLTASEVAAHYGRGYIEGQEDMKQLGWHPAIELPVIPEGEDSVSVYCLVYEEGADEDALIPMQVKFTKLLMLGWVLDENIIVKWWCYPPNEE